MSKVTLNNVIIVVKRWKKKMKNKVVIIGCGNVGMSYAYALLNQKTPVTELVLIDVNEERALGEAMAINMVAGGAVNIPLPFNSVRTLTTQIVSEMGYASGTHRQVLFTVGLVLYVFIMLINLILLKVRKGGDE